MAERQIPEGLEEIGRALLPTDRFMIEKKRAAMSRVLTLVDATYDLTGVATRLTAAEAAAVLLTSRVTAAEAAAALLGDDVMGLDTDLDALTSVVTALSGTVTVNTSDLVALLARVVALENPTPIDADAAAFSWTTQQRIRNIHALALAVFTTNASVGQWPIWQSRLLMNFSVGNFGMRVNVPTGHYLNGVLNGSTGTVGTTPAAANRAIYGILVTREDTDRWSWV